MWNRSTRSLPVFVAPLTTWLCIRNIRIEEIFQKRELTSTKLPSASSHTLTMDEYIGGSIHRGMPVQTDGQTFALPHTSFLQRAQPPDPPNKTSLHCRDQHNSFQLTVTSISQSTETVQSEGGRCFSQVEEESLPQAVERISCVLVLHIVGVLFSCHHEFCKFHIVVHKLQHDKHHHTKHRWAPLGKTLGNLSLLCTCCGVSSLLWCSGWHLECRIPMDWSHASRRGGGHNASGTGARCVGCSRLEEQGHNHLGNQDRNQEFLSGSKNQHAMVCSLPPAGKSLTSSTSWLL